MGGGGSIQGMITSLRNNKNLLSKRKSMFDRKTRSQLIKRTDSSASEAFVKKPVSQKMLLEIKEKAKRRNKRYVFFLLFFGLTIGFLAVLFVKSMIEQEAIAKTNQITKQQELMGQQYLYFIEDGDKWFEEKNWYNAVFQYQKAVNLYPNDFNASYRLALAYSYHCLEKKKNCSEGFELTQKLLIQSPEDAKLLHLRNLY